MEVWLLDFDWPDLPDLVEEYGGIIVTEDPDYLGCRFELEFYDDYRE